MRTSILLIAITTISIFTGCSKKSESKSTGSMTATINGESFKAQYCTVGSSSLGGLYITGFNTGLVGRRIELSITNYTDGATGTYALTTYPDQTVTAVLDSNNIGQVGQSGTITITSSSASAISGTFSFTCINGTLVWTVTNGVFKAIKS